MTLIRRGKVVKIWSFCHFNSDKSKQFVVVFAYGNAFYGNAFDKAYMHYYVKQPKTLKS